MKNNINALLNKHPRISRIIFSLFAGFLTVLLAASVSNIIYRLAPTTTFNNDQTMFYYMGKQLALGKTPYVDFYDHKGLYLIYYVVIGYLIGGKVGFFFIQCLNLSLFYYVFLLTCQVLNFNLKKKVIAVIFFMAIFGAFHQSPSDFEPQMVVIMCCLYFYIKGIKEDKEKDYLIGNIFTGLSAGIAINIRASDAMVAFSLVVFYLVHCLKHHRYKNIFINAGVCLGALLLACLPPLVHSYFGGFTKQMYDAIIFTNFKYVSSIGKGMSSQPTSILCRVAIIFAVILLFVTIYHKRKQISEDEYYFHLVSIIVVGLIQYAIAIYPHYFMTCFPYLVLFIVRFTTLSKKEKPIQNAILFTSLATILFSIIYYPMNYKLVEEKQAVAIQEFVDATISEEDKKNATLCYGSYAGVYINSDLGNAFPDFSAQIFHSAINPDFSDRNVIEYLKTGECKYIIINENYFSRVISWVKSPSNPYFAKIDDREFAGGTYIDIYQYQNI